MCNGFCGADLGLLPLPLLLLLLQSAGGLTVEQRLIPKEPSYLIMNLAMSSNAWAKVDETLTYPGVIAIAKVDTIIIEPISCPVLSCFVLFLLCSALYCTGFSCTTSTAGCNVTWLGVYAGVMSVDHVRIWQRPGRVSIGCDTPDYPTSEYISCNRDLYMPESEKGTWKFVYCSAFRNVVRRGGTISNVVVASCLSLAGPAPLLCLRRSYMNLT